MGNTLLPDRPTAFHVLSGRNSLFVYYAEIPPISHHYSGYSIAVFSVPTDQISNRGGRDSCRKPAINGSNFTEGRLRCRHPHMHIDIFGGLVRS